MLSLFFARMPYIDSNAPKSIFCSALVDKFFRIARSSLLYKDLMKKLWNCLIEQKYRWHSPSGVERYYPKSFENMEKGLPVLVKIVMKFFLKLIFKLES